MPLFNEAFCSQMIKSTESHPAVSGYEFNKAALHVTYSTLLVCKQHNQMALETQEYCMRIPVLCEFTSLKKSLSLSSAQSAAC